MPRARHKPTTNEFYRSVLDNALREQWTISEPEVHKEKIERSRRLSSLYGYSMNSSVVKERMIKSRGGTAGSGKSRRSKQPSIAENARSKRLTACSSDSMIVGQNLYEPSVGLLGEPSLVVGNNGKTEVGDSLDMLEENVGVAKTLVGKKKRGRKEKATHLDIGNSMFDPDGKLQPWYLGYNNSVNQPPSCQKAIVKRYGQGGALNINRFEQGFNSRSIDYRTTNVVTKKSLPKYLGDESLSNPYSDPLFGAPGRWPGKADYVTGSNLKEKEQPMEIKGHLKDYMQRIEDELNHFNKSVMKEKKKDHEYRSIFQSQRPTLLVDSSTGRPINENNRLIQESRKMRYWTGMTALCRNDEDQEAMGQAFEKRQQHKQAMMELRWSESLYIYKLLRSLSVHLKPSLDEFNLLAAELKNAAKDNYRGRKFGGGGVSSSAPFSNEDVESETAQAENAHEKQGDDYEVESKDYEDEDAFDEDAVETKKLDIEDESNSLLGNLESVLISREMFVNIVCGHFEHCDRRRINKLYSGFDIERIDELDYRQVLITQRCLWKYPHEETVEKLMALFRVMNNHRNTGMLSRDEVVSIVSVCSIFDEELEAIDQAFKIVLMPTIRAYTIYSEPGYISQQEFKHCITYRESLIEENPIIREFSAQLDRRLSIFTPHSPTSPVNKPPSTAASSVNLKPLGL